VAETDAGLNVVLIMTDQHRADLCAADGYALDTTPFIDSLGESGIRLRHAYTSGPICYPARNSILTGRFNKAHGAKTNFQGAAIRFEQDLTDVLAEQGYTSVLSGKNHTYLNARDLPKWRGCAPSHGFDVWFRDRQYEPTSLDAKRLREYQTYSQGLRHGVALEPTPFPVEYSQPWRCVEKAIRWLDNFRAEPFFLQVSMTPPHSPYHVPEPYFSLFPEDEIPERLAGPEALTDRSFPWRFNRQLMEHSEGEPDERFWRRYRANYLGMLRLIDDQVKRLVEHMDGAGLLDRTVFVLTSDHGDFAGDYGLMRKGVGLPECLVRVPMTWFGAGVRPHAEMPCAHVSLVDIMPTFCEITGAAIPRGVQGRSLWPMLTGHDYCEPEFRSMCVEYGGGGIPYQEEDDPPTEGFITQLGRPDSGVRPTWHELNHVATSGRWDAVIRWPWKLMVDAYEHYHLHHLADDPAELHNLTHEAAHQDTLQAMTRELVYWMRRSVDVLPLDLWQPKGARHNWLRDPAKAVCHFEPEDT
jgi:arylsulfatase A-like enzyme